MDKYYQNDSISYSMLRNLSVGPAYFKKVQEEEQVDKEHFIIGSCVDTLLTEPDKFWEKYALEFQEECKKVPTGQMKEFSDALFEFEKSYSPEEAEKRAYEYVEFKRKNDTFDAIIEKYVDTCLEYDEWLNSKAEYEKKNKDKQFLTPSQYHIITKIVESLKFSRYTKQYFTDNFYTNIEQKWQVEIYWEFKDNKCKSKLDLVYINHDLREIHPIDIKTTGNSPFSFDLSSLKWRYDLQSSMYSSALYWLINKSNDEYWNNLKDYKIKPFKFIVESSKYPGLPLIYECSESFLNSGISGFKKDGRYYKGFIELIHDYNWYTKHNCWDYPREVIENEGVIELKYD